MTTRTDYRAVTPTGYVTCTFETLALGVEFIERRSGSVPLTLVRVETTETITPVWPEPAKLRAVA